MGLLVTATLACALATIVGSIALARGSGRPTVAGAEGPPPPGANASTPFGRLKATIEAGDWGRAGPALLVMGGLLGIMLFGSLALIFVFDQARSGWPMFGLAVVTIGWAIREYVRAEPGS